MKILKLILTLSVLAFLNCKHHNNDSEVKKSAEKLSHKNVIYVNDTTSSGYKNTVEINGTIYKISGNEVHISKSN